MKDKAIVELYWMRSDSWINFMDKIFADAVLVLDNGEKIDVSGIIGHGSTEESPPLRARRKLGRHNTPFAGQKFEAW